MTGAGSDDGLRVMKLTWRPMTPPSFDTMTYERARAPGVDSSGCRTIW